MKILYIDCNMGAAGDMLSGALLELIPDKEAFIRKINSLGIPHTEVKAIRAEKCGIKGTHIEVLVNGMSEGDAGDEHFHHEHGYEHHHEHQHYHDHDNYEHNDREQAHEHVYCLDHDYNDMHQSSHDYDYESVHEHNHCHDSDHEHDNHEHDHDHAHNSEQEHGYVTVYHHDHNHNDIHEHNHCHDSDHEHDNHEHEHDHAHNSDHEHGNVTEHHFAHDHSDHEQEQEHGHEHAHHHHTSMKDIEDLVSGFNVSEKVRADILSVYKLIAEAESAAHGRPVEEIHFHEVGTMDAVCDITMVCLLIDEIAPDKIFASQVHVGSGHVHCAHGILPVPAPATAYILKGVPIYGGEIEGELCTPTGAALLKHFVSEFGHMPSMRLEASGLGLGTKDFKRLNGLRIMLGETSCIASKNNHTESKPAEDECETVVELSCNIDDMNPEDLACACEILREAGALEVFVTSVYGKKNRVGALLTVISAEDMASELVRLIFKHTTTLGIRENICRRYTLDRREEAVQTPYGTVRKKISEGYGVTREKYEHDDLKKIALQNNMSIQDVIKMVLPQ